MSNFVVKNLGASQASHCLIEFLNKYTQEGHPSLLFFDQMHRHPQQLLFSTMNVLEAYNCGGTYVTMDFEMTKRVRSFPCSKKQYFYIWDMEWIREQKPYRYWADVILDYDITLIARCDAYRKTISDCFNRDVEWTCPDFNYEIMKHILNHDTKN